MDSGDRLLRAVANEQKSNPFADVGTEWTKPDSGWRTARREVEKSAQVYAAALRTYRMAMLSELGPLASARSAMLGRVSKHRERARGGHAVWRRQARTCHRSRKGVTQRKSVTLPPQR